MYDHVYFMLMITVLSNTMVPVLRDCPFCRQGLTLRPVPLPGASKSVMEQVENLSYLSSKVIS